MGRRQGAHAPSREKVSLKMWKIVRGYQEVQGTVAHTRNGVRVNHKHTLGEQREAGSQIRAPREGTHKRASKNSGPRASDGQQDVRGL